MYSPHTPIPEAIVAKTVIIMGAAGRDFHNFNMLYRNNPEYRVAAFTASQIDGIDNRHYPASLAGPGYSEGIPIRPEAELETLIAAHQADVVLFSYSDVPHEYVMHCASQVQACGADFVLAGARSTMLRSNRPVIAVCAVRTGCGKSQTTRALVEILRNQGLNPAVVRHPMPYGDLSLQAVQRFETHGDFDTHHCTLEEREEYEPLVDMGATVWSGVDYEAVLRQAEADADIILWDGGNNDTPFFAPDVHITLLDPHRPGHELSYYPGETNLLMADVAVIAKTDTASDEGIARVESNVRRMNPSATMVRVASPVVLDAPEAVQGKRVLVVEDGPTLTHGEMSEGAGVVAARKAGAAELVDPRNCAMGSIREVFDKHPHIGPVLPAMGYGKPQIADLEATINSCECDAVVLGTPADLRRVLSVDKQVVLATYSHADSGEPTLQSIVTALLDKKYPEWRRTRN